MNSSASQDGQSVSSKQWFLTYSEEQQQVLIWRNGMRLKLKNGSSGGPVQGVEGNEADQSLTVS